MVEIRAGQVGRRPPAFRSYSFGTPTLGVAGDYFRLCWAPNATRADAEDLGAFRFEVDSGAELIGPCALAPGNCVEKLGKS